MRVLFDMAFIGKNTNVTGIPRVCFEYIRWSQPYLKQVGVDSEIVYTNSEGCFYAACCMPDWLGNINQIPNNNQLNEKYKRSRKWVKFTKVVYRPATGKVAKVLDWLSFRRAAHFVRDIPEARIRSIESQNMADRKLTIGTGDILFCGAYWHDELPSSYHKCKAQGAKIVILIHDILPITHQSEYNEHWAKKFERNLSAILLVSDLILTVSGFTKLAVIDFCRKKNIRVPRIETQYHGCDVVGMIAKNTDQYQIMSSTMLKKYNLKTQEYFLMVGSIEPKKQHSQVIDEFERLWMTGNQDVLIIVGRKGWMFENIVEKINSSSFKDIYLFWYDTISDEEINLLYQNAKAVVMASQAEGFGLPIIESLYLGTPVAANRIGVFEELISDHAVFFDIDKRGDLARVLMETQWDTVRSKVIDFVWPSWKEQSTELVNKLVLLE
jgi:glycosyltransferase involved in cell wall biosynthesis